VSPDGTNKAGHPGRNWHRVTSMWARPSVNLPEIAGRPSRPILSVITVVRRDADGLRRTLDSLGPRRDGIEIVVVDGDEPDSACSNEVLPSHELRDSVQVVCGPDRGPYDAMNRGVLASRGEWVWFLNAGDEAFNGVAPIFAIIERTNRPWVAAAVMVVGAQGHVVNPAVGRSEIQSGSATQCHQGVLVRRDAMVAIGLYDLRYRIASDYDFLNKLSSIAEPELIQQPIAYFFRGGLSTIRRRTIHWEQFAIRVRYGRFSLRWHVVDAARTSKRIVQGG
jgi:glycosyltransferase involved in cell wall biosynthesis